MVIRFGEPLHRERCILFLTAYPFLGIRGKIAGASRLGMPRNKETFVWDIAEKGHGTVYTVAQSRKMANARVISPSSILLFFWTRTELNANTREELLTMTLMITNSSFNSKNVSHRGKWNNRFKFLLYLFEYFIISNILISSCVNNNLNYYHNEQEHCEMIMKIYLHTVFMGLERKIIWEENRIWSIYLYFNFTFLNYYFINLLRESEYISLLFRIKIPLTALNSKLCLF